MAVIEVYEPHMKAEIAGINPKSWTLEQCNIAMDLYALQSARLLAREAALQEDLAKVRHSYEEQILEGQAEVEAIEELLKTYAMKHKSDFRPRDKGGEVRSYQHAGVDIGFHQDPKTVRVKGGDDKAAVRLEEDYGLAYIIVTKKPDRAVLKAVLEAGNDHLTANLARKGITLEPGKDRFFVKVE